MFIKKQQYYCLNSRVLTEIKIYKSIDNFAALSCYASFNKIFSFLLIVP